MVKMRRMVASLIASLALAGWAGTDLYPSDHYPVTATVLLP